jgi:alpha-beta hydrolase superfamily lysophospholipase
MSTQPGASLTHRTGTFRTDDGLHLFWQAWAPTTARANVLLSHGLGEHGGRYARLAGDLAVHGIAVWAPDHRGHGRSPGPRGHVSHFQRFADDFESFRRHVAPELAADVPLFVYGHSLGGLIALRHLQTHPHAHYRGAVLSAPLLGFHARAPRWKTALAGVLTRVLPALPLANEIDPAELSHDAEYVASYRNDPLVHPWISPRMYTEMVAAIESALAQGAALRLPLLFVLPGADPIVRTDASRAFARGLEGDVTVRVYEGMFHEAHNEMDCARVVADVATWIAAHSA